jgi:hypothetical protein
MNEVFIQQVSPADQFHWLDVKRDATTVTMNTSPGEAFPA